MQEEKHSRTLTKQVPIKYILHACEPRMWYVEGFLLPSLRAQGIEPEICLDEGLGCLQTTMNCFKECGDAWHIQDDVVICEDFAERTRDKPEVITCGFVYMGFGPDVGMMGRVNIRDAWYSFPCIYIPGEYAAGCAEWFETYARWHPRWEGFARLKINDDGIFRDYMLENHPDAEADNLNPCLVDHIDTLIGGSRVGNEKTPRPATYWYDDAPNRKLNEWLKEISKP